jgi:hypothetical protein
MKSLTAIVNRLVELRGSNFGNSIAACNDFQASRINGAIVNARDVGCIPVGEGMNNSSFNTPLKRAREWLTADWLKNTFSLARKTLRSSMTASKTRRRFRSSLLKDMVMSLAIRQVHGG